MLIFRALTTVQRKHSVFQFFSTLILTGLNPCKKQFFALYKGSDGQVLADWVQGEEFLLLCYGSMTARPIFNIFLVVFVPRLVKLEWLAFQCCWKAKSLKTKWVGSELENRMRKHFGSSHLQNGCSACIRGVILHLLSPWRLRWLNFQNGLSRVCLAI